MLKWLSVFDVLVILAGIASWQGGNQVFAEEIDQALINQAVQLIKDGKQGLAEKLAKSKLEKEESPVEALIILAECRIWTDDPYQAIKYLEQAVKKSKHKAWDVYLNMSTALLPLLYQQKDIDQRSKEYYEFYLDLQTKEIVADPPRDFDPHGSDALYWRANMIGDMNTGSDFDTHPEPKNIRDDFAICEITMVILTDPEYSQLVSCYMARAFHWESRADYSNQRDRDLLEVVNDNRRRVEIADNPDEYLHDLAEALMEASKHQKALDLLPKELSKLEPYYHRRWLGIQANCLKELERFQQAIPVYSKLIEQLAKDEAEVRSTTFRLNDRAECFLSLGRYDEAMADINRSIELHPDGHGYQLSQKYRIMLRQGKWDEIQRVIDSPESDSNDPASARYHRMVYYVELKQWEKAREDFNMLKPEEVSYDFELYNHAATIYENLGQPDLSKKYKERYREIYDSLEPWER